MRRKSEKFLFMVFLGGFLCAGMSTAQDQEKFHDVPVPATLAYDDWASSLEKDTSTTAVWQFPFGAPRPSDLSSQELKIVLSLRRLVMNRNLPEMESVANQVARRQGVLPAQIRFWLAYTQSQLGQREACLANLQTLLRTSEAWLPLEIGQRAWVLTQTADLLFLLSQRSAAVDCYLRLSVSPMDQLRFWGLYQLAGMAFLERDFAMASQHYNDVCEGENTAAWRGHACAMATIADRLTRLPMEGELHGGVATSGH